MPGQLSAVKHLSAALTQRFPFTDGVRASGITVGSRAEMDRLPCPAFSASVGRLRASGDVSMTGPLDGLRRESAPHIRSTASVLLGLGPQGHPTQTEIHRGSALGAEMSRSGRIR